jgi:transcription antitermination factor NusG
MLCGIARCASRFILDTSLRASIQEMEGVIRLFMVDFHPIAIPWTVIARIQEIVAQWQDESEKRMMGTVQVGNAVRIVDHGGFTGLFGEVVEIDEVQRRVRIDLEIFKRVTPMWLAEGKFEVV